MPVADGPQIAVGRPGALRHRVGPFTTLSPVDHDGEADRSAPDEPLVRLRREMRQAFIDGAEEDARIHLGRGLTDEEMKRVLRRYPGDIGERREP